MTRERELRHLRHAPQCVTGARAETRGGCTCGAIDRAPAFVLRILSERDESGRQLVQVSIPQALTWLEVCALQLALEQVQSETARTWARDRGVVIARCTCGAPVAGLLADCESCIARARMSDADAEPDVAGAGGGGGAVAGGEVAGCGECTPDTRGGRS